MSSASRCKFLFIFFTATIFLVSASFCTAKDLILQLPWHHQFQFAGYYMAKELGYYADAGLSVEIKAIEHNMNTVEEVLSGNADFGVSGSGLLVERSLGKPVVAVATILQDAPTVFLTLESSGIRKAADLIDKRVMLSPGHKSLSLLTLLHQEKLLDKVVLQETSYSLTSLPIGETDAFNAYRTNEPFLAAEQGINVNIIAPQDYGINFYGDTLFTSEKFIKSAPDIVEKFRLASLKGWAYALNHIDETIALIKSAYGVEKSLEALKFEAKNIRLAIRPEQVAIGNMDAIKWIQISQYLIAIEQIAPPFQLDQSFLYQPPAGIDWQQLRPLLLTIALAFSTLIALLAVIYRTGQQAKRALADRETSEQRYHTLVESVPGLIYSYSPTLGGTCYSPHLKRVLGHPVEDLRENPQLWHDSIHPDDVKQVDQVLADLKFGRIYELEYRIEDKQGDWHWFSDHFSKRQDPNLGEVVDGIATDITEQKQAKLRQAEEEQRLHEALEAVSDGIWDWDVQTGEATLDQRSKEIFGLAPDKDYTSVEIFSRVDPSDIPHIKEALNAHISGKTDRYDHSFRVHRPDGTTRWVRGRGRIIERNSQGEALRIIGTNSDITERIQTEQKRQQSERRFREIIEQVESISIHGYDEKRQVIFWNRASEELYGYSETEAMGQKLEDLIIPEPICSQIVSQVQGWIETGKEIPPGELLLVGKDGRDVPVFSSHVMQETATGKEMFCIDIDLRPIKQAEQQRRELESQLRQTYKMEAIGTMAGGIAHDFNNHLAIILGNVEMATIKLPKDDRVQAYLKQIKTTANRSKELVKQILLYSRRSRQDLKPVRLNLVIDETLKLLRSTIPSSIDIDLSVAEDAKQQLISADAIQIQQVLINLSSNAAQAMDEKGQLQISLTTTTLSQKDLPAGKTLATGQYLKLSVSDSGAGMPPDVLQKIFDPFFTTKTVNKGTGLGLSVVHGIVENHKGFISATSIPGEGSCFDIYFPTIEAEYETLPPQKGPLPTGNERVLVLDDEENLATLCAEMLTEYGYQTSTETDSQKVVQSFQKNPQQYDLLITDQTMPNLSGTELSKQLLQLRPDLPIILCTGYSAKASATEAQRIGIREFCMKPLALPQLVKTVRKVLDEMK